jgi:hypothetical protein
MPALAEGGTMIRVNSSAVDTEKGLLKKYSIFILRIGVLVTIKSVKCKSIMP